MRWCFLGLIGLLYFEFNVVICIFGGLYIYVCMSVGGSGGAYGFEDERVIGGR